MLSIIIMNEFQEKSSYWDNPLGQLRNKWHEVPAGNVRMSTKELLSLSDEELRDTWLNIRQSAVTGAGFNERGWYHALYRDFFSTRKIMDVGSGLGIDGITFAENGARVTFVDIVQSNLEVIKRLCNLFGIKNVNFCYLQNLESLRDLPRDYDVIWCQGSLINAPFENMRDEAREILNHLPVGGRWIELAYPKNRWIREGRMPFSIWGNFTDGEGTPWMEWYDLEKVLERLDPVPFDVIMSYEFHNGDFIWFDLQRVEKHTQKTNDTQKEMVNDIAYTTKPVKYTLTISRSITLFSRTSDKLIKSLQISSKHGIQTESILTKDPSGIWFNPTDRHDSLATPFLAVGPELIEGKKRIRIIIRYKKGASPGKGCMIYLQNEQYQSLTPPINFDEAYALNSSDMEITMEAGIEQMISMIRLVFTTNDGATTYIPHALIIEQLRNNIITL